MIPVSLLIEAAEKLSKLAPVPTSHTSLLYLCQFCEGRWLRTGGRLDHTPDCLITRLRTAAQESERGEQTVCPTCKNEPTLHMWDRPGGPPGNGYGPCPTCKVTRYPSYDDTVTPEQYEVLRQSVAHLALENWPPEISPPTLDAEIEAERQRWANHQRVGSSAYNSLVFQVADIEDAIDRTVAIMDRRVRELCERLDDVAETLDNVLDDSDFNENSEYTQQMRRSIRKARIALGKPDGGRG